MYNPTTKATGRCCYSMCDGSELELCHVIYDIGPANPKKLIIIHPMILTDELSPFCGVLILVTLPKWVTLANRKILVAINPLMSL